MADDAPAWGLLKCHHAHFSKDRPKKLKILARSLVSFGRNSSSDTEDNDNPTYSNPVDHQMIQLYVKQQQSSERSRSSSSVGIDDDGPSDRSRSDSSGRVKSTSLTCTVYGSPTFDKWCSTKVVEPKSLKTAAAGTDEAFVEEYDEKEEAYMMKAASTLTAYTGPSFQQVTAPGSDCYRVLDFLYVSGITVSLNPQLMCKLKVEYLLDASGVDPQDLPHSMRSTCPCLCLSPNAHSRVQMTLDLTSTTAPTSVLNCFDDVNRFIAAARANRKKLLVFSNEGFNRAPTLVIQYIMSYYNIPCEKAKAFLNNSCPRLKLTPNLERALELWEQHLAKTNARKTDIITAHQPPTGPPRPAW